jgi:phosphohistidine phosphatase
MQLYLMRHGEAQPELTNEKRPLSETGRNDIQRVAAFVRANIAVKVDTVFHSGKTRARETAEIIFSAVTSSMPMQIDNHLSPNADPEIWKDRLVGERENLMLVGHLPHLNRLGALLVCADALQTVVNFSTGTLVCLESHDSESWVVRWVITPEFLKRQMMGHAE